MTLVHWSWLLVVLALIDWAATVTLVRASARSNEPALEERAIAAVILTFAASLIALLALAFILNFDVPSDVGTTMLIGSLLLLSAPQLVWVLAYELGQFR